MKSILLSVIIFFGFLSVSLAQYVIKGKVTDIETGDPIPFASVILKGTKVGITTDFEGNYTISTTVKADSLQVSYVGYISQSKPVIYSQSILINFQLVPSTFNLSEFVFESGENPAFPIIRKAVEMKEKFDKRNLTAYESENYTKIELDLDEVEGAFKERNQVKKVIAVMDSIKQLTNDEGKKILPVFFSETYSKFYFRTDPLLKKEVIENSKLSGVGITDGTTVSQITGSAFQEYNFYRNWLTIVEKEFVSPIADGWKTFYDYDLMDSVMVGEDFCYMLKVYPLREQDLAFKGTIWIKKEDYALKQVDLTIPKSANLNFIERIKIQQELVATDAGPLLPSKTRILIKISKITENTVGLLAKFYNSGQNFTVNNPKPPSFYFQAIQLKEDFDKGTEEFWQSVRPEQLSDQEIVSRQMVDTLSRIPVIRFYSEGIKFLGTGFLPVGKVDLGPWTGLLNYNNVEGLRLGAGLRTNLKFSNKYVLSGYLAYGFADNQFKYFLSGTKILDRKRWTTIQINTQREIDQVGLEIENLSLNSIFLAASRFGTLNKPYYAKYYRLISQREVFKGFNLTAGFTRKEFDPVFDFNYLDENTGTYQSRFDLAQVNLGIRYGKDEVNIINDNYRVSLGPVKWPVFDFRFTQGLNSLGGDINYQKYVLSVYQKLNLGLIGVSRYELRSGFVRGTVPYPLLENHIGNETIFYTTVAFNLMNFNEFASDRFASLSYRHSFEGFGLNWIPLIKKLKWRAVANANVLWGSVSDKNLMNSSDLDADGNPFPAFGRLDQDLPYIELGYGIENIFKFFRVDFFHRLTYLDNPGANSFGVKVSAQIIL
ncbi:DUF5686 and carboxypeptidase-like regulatory domain-containing protein [Aquiflexum gelatinilyticum]|uniref:DUF5686 and carboxypeptidase-like regulatory domain-containing protein n=1 Tax=Aquiflexum gelatinilyticum TaxID=2961943 RepID=UPI0021699425|nr:DUF5686 and carboxypeptidase-like regulatory domain-containing protein [Aquiflexum gelatinilyticum]MCS4432783.1 DUF5686 and carboxypeptidase regulatory-like domain-containing protein [Aquiflexum gelatinilyticum]